MFTLTHAATTQSLEAWGVKNLVLSRVNQGVDKLTLREPGATYDTAPTFAYDAPITLKSGSTILFSGRVQTVRRAAADGDESRLYTIAGPWSWLEQIVYQQNWKTTDGVDSTPITSRRSRVIIGQDIDGNKIDTSAEMTAAVQWAIDNGAPITLGTIDAGVTIPYQELIDVTVAELIRACLRWTPDAAVWFDYTTADPTLHIRRRANLSPVTLALDPAQAKALDCTSREDLQVPAVVLKYEKSHSYNGETWSTIQTDQAPPTATGFEPRALVATIALEGSTENVEEQKLETETIAPTSATWWKKRDRSLTDYPVGDLQVTDATILEDDGAGGLQVSSLSKFITVGSAQDWMTGVTAKEVVVKANIKYTGSDPSLKPIDTTFAVSDVGTDASRSRYTRTVSFTDAEPVPTGLAQSLYDALSILHWQGTYTLLEDTASSVATPGNTLRLTGGLAAWADMDAMIQQIETDLDEGETRITFGPPEHLGPQDLVEQLRANRARRPSYYLNERTTGQKAANGGLTSGAQKTAKPNATSVPSAGIVSAEVTLTYCNNGTPVDRIFYVKASS